MELIVQEDWHNNSVSYFLRSMESGRTVVIGQKDGLMVEQTLDPNNPLSVKLEPLMQMSFSLSEKFLKAVAEYLSGRNIKTENENLLQGKLAATEKHLDDLRQHFTKVLDKVIQ